VDPEHVQRYDQTLQYLMKGYQIAQYNVGEVKSCALSYNLSAPDVRQGIKGCILQGETICVAGKNRYILENFQFIAIIHNRSTDMATTTQQRVTIPEQPCMCCIAETHHPSTNRKS
jgi:hypothetical protein